MTLCSRFTILLAVLFASVSGGHGAKPFYTLTVPTGQALRTSLEVTPDTNGSRRMRVRAAQTPATPGSMSIDSLLLLDADRKLLRGRTEARSALGLSVLEATLQENSVILRNPEQTGSLRLGAPVISTLDALAFLGKRYDWTKGGVQHFAPLLDVGLEPAQLVTMTLEAAGTEKLSLSDGDVTARKLKFGIDLPQLPKEVGATEFLIGPNGEMLSLSVPVFGAGLKARGPAVVENGDLVMRLAQPPGVLLRRTRSGAGYEAKLETENGMEIGSVVADAAYRPQRIRNIFRGREFTATLTPAEIRWRMAAGNPQSVALTGDPWFLPHLLATELWEDSPALASLPSGEKRQVTYFPLELALPTGVVVTLERLADTVVASPGGNNATLRQWRITMPLSAMNLWTDGKRLVKMAGSDKTTIVRAGWEKATAALLAPAAPSPPQ